MTPALSVLPTGQGNFIQRNKIFVSAASLVVALSVGFGVVASYQARQIKLESENVRQISEFMISLFEEAST